MAVIVKIRSSEFRRRIFHFHLLLCFSKKNGPMESRLGFIPVDSLYRLTSHSDTTFERELLRQLFMDPLKEKGKVLS